MLKLKMDFSTIIPLSFTGCNFKSDHPCIAGNISMRILMMFLVFNLCCTKTCPTTTTNSNVITSDQCSFTGFTTTRNYGVVSGSISKSLYISYAIYTPNSGALRKVNPDDSVAWMTTIPFIPSVKSLTVDLYEQNVYFANWGSPLTVCRLQSNTGSMLDAKLFNFLSGISNDIRIHTLSDTSGYYISGQDTSNKPMFCRYLFSSPTTSQCQKITNFESNSHGELKISDSSYFMIGNDPITYDLHFYRIIFANTSPVWADKMLCQSGTCTASFAESKIIASSIYSFFLYGVSSPLSLYYKFQRLKNIN